MHHDTAVLNIDEVLKKHPCEVLFTVTANETWSNNLRFLIMIEPGPYHS